MSAKMRVNRAYLVVVSQDSYTDPYLSSDRNEWESIWAGHGGVRVFAIDRERCLVPVPVEDFKALLAEPEAPTKIQWESTPQVPEP